MLVTRHPSVNELGERRGVGEEGLLRKTEDERERERVQELHREGKGRKSERNRKEFDTNSKCVSCSFLKN